MPQACGRCAKRFTLSAGAALEGSIMPPPPHPAAFRINLKWSILVTYRFATLEPAGVTSGTLDPVVGMAAIDSAGVAYADVVSIAVWRRLAWPELICGFLMPLPIALWAAYGAAVTVTKSAGFAGFCLLMAALFGLLTFWLLRRGFVIGRRRARIVGRWASFTVPFDKSPAFYEELFRRSGIVAPPIP
jgi:hypothetical protein